MVKTKTENANATRKVLRTPQGSFAFYALNRLSRLGIKDNGRLPFSIKILLENVLRHCDGQRITVKDIARIARWKARGQKREQISFHPARVVLQDFTGVPCVVDLAAMRAVMKRFDADYRKVNPVIPCDLIVDHSLQIDAFGSPEAFATNLRREFERNRERYEFLKWAQNVFRNFRVVPPATGIIHQVNLEYLAQGVCRKKTGRTTVLYPDSCLGTDSHTTMINGLGVLGWGVGGIEAEAVMLGEPLAMLLPDVVGVRMTGRLGPGVTATDLVLTVTEILRAKGVVGKFVEFIGPGIKDLGLADRATISNMAPEYGATVGLFPVDDETLRYYRMTGRRPGHVDLLERYMKEQGLFYSGDGDLPRYSDIVKLDLATVVPCVAGPKRPQDRIPLDSAKAVFRQCLTAPVKDRGYGLPDGDLGHSALVKPGTAIGHGAVVIASITSCTNTSNPELLIAAGLLAKKAVEHGLRVPGYVKTSLAPGSQVVDDYLRKSGLMSSLEALGFHNVGYGCATCIGNSGPLSEEVGHAIEEGHLVAASVLSGNRNFEGRINPLTKANFLASPPLVVAYALAGTLAIDLVREPLGKARDGREIYLRDIWPETGEVARIASRYVTAKAFRERYKNVNAGDRQWRAVKAGKAELYRWDETSTYIQEPPFFVDLARTPAPIDDIKGARVLVMLGDSVTTDHISPAGAIAPYSPAGQYLVGRGVAPKDFNSYGSRRGNDRVMTRGTFANIRLRNQLVPGREGSWTVYFPTGEKVSIFEAAQRYRRDHIPLLVLAGKEYGTGSSRDWAAKGTALLGVKVVLAQSFERIHRSNLVGMGILPLEFQPGDSAERLGLIGTETYDILTIRDGLRPRGEVRVAATGPDGRTRSFPAICRVDTPAEMAYYRNGGILPFVLRRFIA